MHLPKEFLPFWSTRSMPVDHPEFPLPGRRMVTEWVVEPLHLVHKAVVAHVESDDWSHIVRRPNWWGRVQTAMEALMVFDGQIAPENLTHRILLTAVLGEGPLPNGFLAMIAINQVQIVPRSSRDYAPASGEPWEVVTLQMPWLRDRGGYDYRSVTRGKTSIGRPLLKAYVEAHETRVAVRDGR